MPYPSFEESQIYKSSYKLFQIRAMVRLDEPTFVSPFTDSFDTDYPNTRVNPALWNTNFPSWSDITIVGSSITMDTLADSISAPWFSSKDGLAFPRDPNIAWTLDVRMRFSVFAGYGVFFRVHSIEQAEAVLSINGNTADGLKVEDYNKTTYLLDAVGNGWHRYRLVYDPINMDYTLTIDANDDGVYELGPYTFSAVSAQADYIIVGNSTAIQGDLGDWTPIEVDYVTVIGTSETYAIPDWAGPYYLYESLGYQTELWAELPTHLRGSVRIDKENMADGLQIDLLNHDLDTPRIYNGFNFGNRQIKVESRISDGMAWTPWRTIFKGTCDEKRTETRPEGSILTVSARDLVRHKLLRTHIIRAYVTYTEALEGVLLNYTVDQIIRDLIINGARLPFNWANIQQTPWNQPQTFNVADQSVGDSIKKLIDDVVFCWWPDTANNWAIKIQDWFWGTDNPQYQLSSREELTNVDYTENALDLLAQLVLSIENTEFMGGGFSTNFPFIPVPFTGEKSYTDAVVAQDTTDLMNRKLHYLRWKAANRNVGSIEVSAPCQDWMEHDLEIDVVDDRWMGLRHSDGPWVIDGWQIDWEGTQSFNARIRLINQHPERIIRRLIRGQDI